MKTIKPHVFSFLKMLGAFSPLLLLALRFGVWGFFVVFAVLLVHFKSFKVFVFKEKLLIHRGFIFKTTREIFKNRISFISIDAPFFLRLFKIFRVSFYSDFNKTLSLYLNERNTAFILKEFSSGIRKKRHSPKFVSLLFLSLVFSNSLAGVGIIFAFLWQLKKVLSFFGKQLPHPTAINLSLSLLIFLLFFSWVVSALSTLLKNLRFSISLNGETLRIKSGVITVRRSVVCLKDVSFFCAKENLFGKILGISKVFVKLQTSKNCALVPSIKRQDIPLFLNEFLPKFKLLSPTLSPDPSAFLGFVFPSAFVYFLITVSTVVSIKLFPDFSKSSAFLGVVGLVVTAWFCVLKIIDFFTTGIARESNLFSLHYSKGFSLYKVTILREAIVFVEFRQSIIQRIFKKCDVFVHTKGGLKHHVKNLNLQNAVKILKEDF